MRRYLTALLSVFALLMGYEAMGQTWYTTKAEGIDDHPLEAELIKVPLYIFRKEHPLWYCDHFPTGRGGETACIRSHADMPMAVYEATDIWQSVSISSYAIFRYQEQREGDNRPGDSWRLKITVEPGRVGARLPVYRMEAVWDCGVWLCTHGHTSHTPPNTVAPTSKKSTDGIEVMKGIQAALECLQSVRESKEGHRLRSCLEEEKGGIWLRN